MKPQINYPYLGGPDDQKKFYNEGDQYVHPSGTVYVRKDGNWVVLKKAAVPNSENT